MKFKDFEDYLQHKHSMDYRGLDDDMTEAYEEWLEDLDVYEWIDLANSYAEIHHLQSPSNPPTP